ncbi:redoxin domain-containing protein [Bacillus sp. AFS040349]|uniref:redoxin domain-containing protein n=1 Tax=Bacillus sp. AFS040349 TaxID=2033502 RepID=UPI0026CD42EE
MVSAITYTLYLNFFTEKIRVQAGDKAPDFMLGDMEGNNVQLSDLKGKGVFLNFWGTCVNGLNHASEKCHLWKEDIIILKI